MNRTRKTLTATLILAGGVALSWPFRQAESPRESDRNGVSEEFMRAPNGDPITLDSTSLPQLSKGVPGANHHVHARMASTADMTQESQNQHQLESFDLANHPTLKNSPLVSAGDEKASEAEHDHQSTKARPAYPIVDTKQQFDAEDEWPQEVLHVVCNGDTLEGLAERYLDDKGRALEIFDLNRDKLSNPHLLPIGVELRIPEQGLPPNEG